MIPDFYLPVIVEEQAARVLCRDLPTAVFFYGYPTVPEHADGYLVARREWVLGVLSRSIVMPSGVDPSLLNRMGPALDDLERRYWAAVGWRVGGAASPIDGFGEGPPPPAPASWLPALASAPSPRLLQGLLDLADVFHVAPHVLWLGPISEYLLSLSLALGRQKATQGGYPDLPRSVRDIGLAEGAA